jgi:hypothetical protein
MVCACYQIRIFPLPCRIDSKETQIPWRGPRAYLCGGTDLGICASLQVYTVSIRGHAIVAQN